MLSNEYIAGFFDGEGSIGLYPHSNQKKFFLLATISNTVPDILREIQGQFGGLIASTEKGQRKHRLYKWTVYGEIAGRFLTAIHPYLHIKQDQSKLALKYLSERPDVPGRTGYSIEFKADQLWYYEEFKRLKRAGMIAIGEHVKENTGVIEII